MRRDMVVRSGFALALAAGAALVRWPALAPASWSIDPIITWQIARKPFFTAGSLAPETSAYESIVAFCLHDTGPGPLAYLLDGALAPWARPWGAEGWLAVPSFTAGLVLIALPLLLARRLTGGTAGGVAMAACIAAFPLFAELSAMPRGYQWAMLALTAQLALASALVSRETPPTHPGRRWAAFLVLAILAFFIHPLSIAASAGLGAAVLAVHRRGDRGLKLGAVLGGGAAVGAITGAWVWLWARALNAESAGQATAFSAAEMGGRWVELAAEAWRQRLPLFALAAVALAIPAGRAHSPDDRRRLTVAAAALAAELLLAVVFLARFFPALRHFYPVPLLLFWVIGILAEAAWRNGARHRRTALAMGLAALMVLPARDGAVRLRTPDVDWAALVRRYQQIRTPEDIVLVGPNSELEVFWTYAESAGLDIAAAPRHLVLPDGRRVDTQTEEGIRAALTSPRPVYFFTGSWGLRRPPGYWRTVEEGFLELEPIPGRTPIRAFRRR